MKNNFLSKVTKMPQNTGGGNSQTKRATLALPLRYLCAMLLALFMGVGQMWAADITVTPPTPNNASNPFSTGLYVMSVSGTGSKLSSGAITTSTNGAVITINFQATKSDMYIKTITFNSLGNGTLSSDDGTFDGQVFTATGNKNSVNVVLTSGSGKKGTVKVTNVVVNTGTNVVETITFTGVDSGDGQKATFTSSAATSALSSITTDASAFSVSSGKLSWTNGKKVILTAESNIKYVAFSIADGKMYGNKFSATEDTYNDANYTWSGSSKTVTLTNGSGGGREIKGLYVIIDPVVKHQVTYSLGGDYGTTPTQADVAEGAKFTLHNGTTGITAPSGQQFAGWNDGTTTYAGGAEYTMGTDDVELTAVWETAKTNPTATFSNGAYVVGASALDLSGLWSSNSDGAVTYALKEASDDASVSGTSFTATKAGSYVVTASQAATSTYNAISKEATITVTWPATGDAVVTYNLDVTNNGTTLQTLATTNATSSSISVSASTDLLAGGLTKSSSKGTHNGTRTLGINTLAEETADKYFNVTFSVADGKMFTPTAISLKVLTIGGNATSYKAVLTDGVNSIIGTVDATNDSEKTLGNWIGLGTTNLSGTVTLKLYAWYTTSGSYNAYRLSTPITISGTVAVKPTPAAPAITAPTTDQTAEYDLNDVITPLEVTATGYPAPAYQWYKNATKTTEGATAIDGAENASYTPANNVASDFYYYCVATNASGSATSHFFHVTVNAPTVPTIYTETTAMSLVSNKVATDSKKFTFSGINLDETPVTLVLASEVDGLTLSTSSVTPTAGSIADTEITVSYKSVVDVAEANVNLYLKHGDDILHTITLTYSSTAGVVDLTSISAATTWNWDGANSSTEAIESLDADNIVVFANYSGWDESFKANSLAGRLQYVYRGSNYAQGHSLKFNTTVPGIVTVSFSNTSTKEVARAPRITDTNGSYAPTDEADGAKTADAKSYSHAVAAGDVLIEGFEMKEGTPANMLRFYEVRFVPTFSVTYMPNGGSGAEFIVDDAATQVRAGSIFTAPASSAFVAWNTQADGKGDTYLPGAAVTADLTLHAQWETSYEVTFNMQDHGDAIDPQNIVSGGKVTKPADPSASGWDFGGWYKESTCENEWNFATDVVTTTTTIFAKWTEDPCPDSEKKSIVKVVLKSATDGTVTGYNNDEYAGEKVIGGLGESNTAEVDPSHEGVETGYKLSSGGSAIVFATLKKGTFQVGDRVLVTITKAQDAYKVEEVAQPILDIYYGTDKNDATFLTTLEGVSAAGTYTYRLTAADVTAIGTKKGIGVFRPSSGRTQNPYVYSVEIKGCRSWAIFHTLTFKNFDGTATIAAEQLEEGAYASTVAPAAPKIATKRFLGWAEAVDGTPVDLTSYTITENKTLYAVYEDIVCPTSGTVYKFEIKDELPSENLPTSTDKDMSSYITATGDGYLTYTATANNKATINSDGTIQMKDQSAAYLKVELECALAAGDQIRAHVTNNPIRVQVGTTYDSNKDLILAKNAYEFVAITSAMEGKQVLYITRSSNGNANLADFEIYRPAKYDVSFNMMGHGSAIADLEDVVEGSKIAAPSPAPTDADYSFAGWYKENTLENEWDFDGDVVDDNITLYAKWLDKSDATLKSLKYGETDIVLVVDQYTYDITLPSLTSSVPALTAETNNPNATKAIVNDTFDGEGNATSTVTVTPEVGADKVYTVNFSRGVALEQVTVTTSMEWDWSAAGVTAEINNTNTPGLSGNDVVIANVPGVNNDADFNSQALKASGTNAIRTTYFQGKELNIKTDKEGMLIVDFSGTNNKARVLKVYDNADTEIAAWSYNSDARQVQQVVVPAGNVTLKAFEGESGNNARIYNLKFYAYDTERNDSWIAPGELGTICYPNGHVFTGAEVYEMAGVDENNKFVFDQVEQTEPGKPYLFVATSYEPIKLYKTTAAAELSPIAHKGMIGTFVSIDLDYTDERAAKWYYFSGKKFYAVSKRASDLNVPANRAYVDMNTPVLAGAPRHGVRRITFDVQGANVATGVENAVATDKPAKMLINGQLFILRGEKMYDAKGQLVK